MTPSDSAGQGACNKTTPSDSAVRPDACDKTTASDKCWAMGRLWQDCGYETSGTKRQRQGVTRTSCPASSHLCIAHAQWRQVWALTTRPRMAASSSCAGAASIPQHSSTRVAHSPHAVHALLRRLTRYGRPVNALVDGGVQRRTGRVQSSKIR